MTARIGLDLDGVVYDWGSTVRYLMREHHGLDLGESTHWLYVKDNVPPEAWRWLWAEGITEHGLFRYGKLYRGAVDGMKALAKLGAVEAVTHRPKAAVRDTLGFLASLPDVLSGVHILTNGEPKSGVGCDVYIDDAPHVAEEVIAAGGRLVLVDQPWNRDLFCGGLFDPHPSRFVRAGGWVAQGGLPSIPAAVRGLL